MVIPNCDFTSLYPNVQKVIVNDNLLRILKNKERRKKLERLNDTR